MANINDIELQTCFTSAIPDIEIEAQADSITVDIGYHGTVDIVIVSLHLYTYQGIATISGLRQIVEQYLEANNLCYAQIYALVNEEGDIVEYDLYNALYCRYAMDTEAEDFIETHFLTTAFSKTIYPNVIERLSWIMTSKATTQSCLFVVTSKTNDGELETITTAWKKPVTDISQPITIEFALTDIEDMCQDGSQPLYFTVTVGSRQMRYYVSQQTASYSFLFANAFNINETVSFIGITKSKTDVSRNIAHCAGQLSFYDTEIEKTFEMETAPLSYLTMLWTEQLIVSHQVFLIYDTKDTLRKILISKSEYSCSDTDNEPNTLKFTWQFADEILHTAETLQFLRLNVYRIFDDTFNLSFK